MKKSSKKLSSLLTGIAFAGLLAGTATLTSCSGGDAKASQNGCAGKNGCGNKKEANGCNGHNGCKGQETKKEANGCNGHNGCKTAEKKS